LWILWNDKNKSHSDVEIDNAIEAIPTSGTKNFIEAQKKNTQFISQAIKAAQYL
jgi:hypothetical protein